MTRFSLAILALTLPLSASAVPLDDCGSSDAPSPFGGRDCLSSGGNPMCVYLTTGYRNGDTEVQCSTDPDGLANGDTMLTAVSGYGSAANTVSVWGEDPSGVRFCCVTQETEIETVYIQTEPGAGYTDYVSLTWQNYDLENTSATDMSAHVETIGSSVILGSNDDTDYQEYLNEICYGSSPSATVYGNDGDDVIYGCTEADDLNGGNGVDTITGEGGDDTIRGGAGADDIDGGSGADTIWGDNGTDTILGGSGGDTIYGGAHADTIDGEGGLDTIHGQEGDDILSGGDDADTIYGGEHHDTIDGGAGDDTIDGGDGDDTIDGGDGDDILMGKDGSDTVNGEDGNDRIWGDAGIDTLTGGNGNDDIAGGGSTDTLSGGPGNDMLCDAFGGDKFLGGTGDDTLYYETTMFGSPPDSTSNAGIGMDNDTCGHPSWGTSWAGTCSYTQTTRPAACP